MGENPSDPVQLYLTQMGDSHLLSRQEEYRSRPANRARPEELPPRDPELRLRASGGRRHAGEGFAGPDAFGDRLRRPVLQRATEAPAVGAAAAERANAASAVEAEPRRFSGGRVEANAGRTSPPVPPSACSSAVARPSVWQRNCPIRRQHLQLVLQRLREISRRMDAAHRELAQPHGDGDRARRKQVRKRVAPAHAGHTGDARHAAPPVGPHRRVPTHARSHSPETLGRQPAARRLDRQARIETAASASSI